MSLIPLHCCFFILQNVKNLLYGLLGQLDEIRSTIYDASQQQT